MRPVKSRSLWPLPGGSAHYLESLLTAISLAHDSPSLEEYIHRFRTAFPSVTSDVRARSYVRDVLQSLNVLEIEAVDVIHPTTAGKHLTTSSNPRAVLLQLLKEQVMGIDELIGLLSGDSMAIRHLLTGMQELGFTWQSEWPVRFRLNWLRTAGVVRRVSGRESGEQYAQWQLIRSV
jgi:hypothetical protein